MKYSSETYLKDVEKHIFTLFRNEEKNFDIIIKKIMKIKTPFQLYEFNKQITVLDKDYSILEYIPHDKNYIVRVFIDDNKNIVEKITLLTKDNSFQNGIPSYEDLKICLVEVNNQKKIYHEELITEELKEKVEELKNIELPFDYLDYIN